MLEKNRIYSHPSHGLIEYKGMDRIEDDFIFKFKSLKYYGGEIEIEDIEKLEDCTTPSSDALFLLLS